MQVFAERSTSPEESSMSVSRRLMGLFCWAIVLCAGIERAGAQPADPETTRWLEAVRTKHDLPGLAVVVVKAGQVCDRGAAGVRKAGDETPVTTSDKFHIGSCTKSMTATLAGMVIDEGKLKWDTTVVDVFPEWKGKIHKDLQKVTVEQLLQNRGGLATEPPGAAWRMAWLEKGSVVDQRRDLLTAVLAEKPAADPGSKMIYSNQGYTLVGAMLEKIDKQPWEQVIERRLFKPLKMDTAGFGFPGSKGKVDEPWGHTRTGDKNKPSQSDNPPAIGPAGRVHCSLDDLAKYAALHLGSKSAPQLLKPETLKRLHTPPAGGDYACGWITLERPWASGTALMHNGSNTMWYAVMWLAPEKDFAVLTATNVGGDKAQTACDDVSSAMIRKWLR
jgi:CubicO group peptidase (beta-lactamase class C family)